MTDENNFEIIAIKFKTSFKLFLKNKDKKDYDNVL